MFLWKANMTVKSTNYSSLEEVWGETFNPSQKPKKEKKKKVHDPICELYEMGNNNGYNDSDIVSYANNYLTGNSEKYDKTLYQRSMNDNTASSKQAPQHERERPVREVVVSNERSVYDVSDNDDVIEDKKHENFQQPLRYFKERHRVPDDDDDELDTSTSNFAFIDLLLYIVSGIILIFVMEQFVRIGLLLQ